MKKVTFLLTALFLVATTTKTNFANDNFVTKAYVDQKISELEARITQLENP